MEILLFYDFTDFVNFATFYADIINAPHKAADIDTIHAICTTADVPFRKAGTPVQVDNGYLNAIGSVLYVFERFSVSITNSIL